MRDKSDFKIDKKMKKELNKNLFWDIDFNLLDLDSNSQFIIERILAIGDLSDWFILKNLYSLERIKEEVVNIRNFTPKTLNFLSVILNIPKEKFRCYNIRQSITKLWNY